MVGGGRRESSTSASANRERGCGCAASVQTDRSCPFRLLGVPPTAAVRDIKRAYYARCLDCHPDRRAIQAASNTDKLQDRFIAVQRAFEQVKGGQYAAHSKLGQCPFMPDIDINNRPDHVYRPPWAAYADMVQRHKYDPNDQRYQNDPGLHFQQPCYATAGTARPRYLSNRWFMLLVVALSALCAGVQYLRVQYYMPRMHHRLQEQHFAALQALQQAEQQARDIGWQGQLDRLQKRIQQAQNNNER